MEINNTDQYQAKSISGAVSDEVTKLFFIILNDITVPLVSVFGILANIINILVYNRLGVKDSSNLSFFLLAISDLCNVIIAILLEIFFGPLISSISDLTFDPLAIGYIAASWPRALFSKTTCCFTVFITIERCLCIAAPLKVKTILTASRTLIILTAMFVICVFISYIHFYTGSLYLTYYFDPVRNKSILGLGIGDNYGSVSVISGNLNTISFLVLFALLVILVYKLQQTSKWRKQSSTLNSKKQGHVSKRDQSVSVTVAVLSSVLIFTYSFYTINCVLSSLTDSFMQDQSYGNLLQIIWMISITLESINSSVSVLIYYKVSSQYRRTFYSFICDPCHCFVKQKALNLI